MIFGLIAIGTYFYVPQSRGLWMKLSITQGLRFFQSNTKAFHGIVDVIVFDDDDAVEAISVPEAMSVLSKFRGAPACSASSET